MKRSLSPLYDDLKQHDRKKLLADLNAGILVAVLLVPQGMAYAFLAGMPPIYGLYGALIPMLVYAFLGTSRKMSIGPVAISAILVLQGVSQLAEPFSPAYIQLVIFCGLLIGIVQFFLGMFRFGYLANFVSHPVLAGFASAAAIIIVINQLKDILGIAIPRFESSFEILFFSVENCLSCNKIALSIFFGGILGMHFLKKLNPKIPVALIAVVTTIILVKVLNLEEQGLDIVGAISPGLPNFSAPIYSYKTMISLIPVVLTVTVIGIVESISIGKVLEDEQHSIRPNEELVALGFAKIAGSFFSAIPSSGSFSRSAVNDAAGAKTQLSSVFASLLIFLTLLFLTPLFYYLPKAILAAIIVMSVLKLFDLAEFHHLWKSHKKDFSVMLLTFLATLLVNIEAGVVAGVLLSLFLVLYKSSKPRLTVLGRVPGTTYYRNVKKADNLVVFKHTLIIRWEDQLYFANAAYFKKSIKKLIRKRKGKITLLVLDAKSIHEIDSSGMKALGEILFFLRSKNITLKICGSMAPFRRRLRESGMIDVIGKENTCAYLHDAIS